MPQPERYPWERRRAGEQTTVYLGRVLDELELSDMARRAREGHFDDFFCPAEVDDGFNIHRLVDELARAARSPKTGYRRRRVLRRLIDAAKEGEFDGTKEESDRWAASKQGQDLIRDLAEGR